MIALFTSHPIVSPGMPSIAYIGFVIGLFIVGILFISLLGKYRQVFIKKYLLRAALIIFLLGFILYSIGFYWEGTKETLTALALRSVLSSLEMFVSHSDLLEVSPYYKECPLYMFIFAIVHFLAVFISAIFAINYLGFRLFSWLKLCWWRWFQTGRELYLFYGENDASFLLAKDITVKFAKDIDEKKKKGHEKPWIIFIKGPDSKEEKPQRMSFSHIFELFSYRREAIEKIHGINAILVGSNGNLPNLDVKEGKDVFLLLGLQKIRDIVGKASSIKLFFLSDDENMNVKSVINILKDKSLNNDRVKAYCHARRNGMNINLECIAGNKVEVIDSSYLSIVSLKTLREGNCISNYRYSSHPINFVEKNTEKGVVTSAFTSMIIGFGETGQDALRFLYEFGAFVDEDGNKSPFKCYCIDERMDLLSERFIQKVPLLNEQNEVEFINGSYNSSDFWERLKNIINELNYIVVSVGDDETSLSLAIEIYEYANKHRHSLDNFHLFIRSYKLENENRMKQIVDSYNDIVKYDEASIDFNGEQEKGRCNTDLLTIFGTSSEIYSKRVIVDNELLVSANEFKTEYNKQYEKNRVKEERKEIFTKRHTKPIILRNQEQQRKDNQNIANALHIYTKVQLIGGYDKVMDCSEECYLNLAKCEHLRWNASHSMMGYTPMSKDMEEKMLLQGKTCNEQLKQHSCLVPWEGLSERLQSYDKLVVDTTFALIKKF